MKLSEELGPYQDVLLRALSNFYECDRFRDLVWKLLTHVITCRKCLWSLIKLTGVALWVSLVVMSRRILKSLRIKN